MAAPERSYAERLGQFRRCLADSTVSTKEWITRWFYYEKKGSTEHVAPSLDELKRGNVREWLSWSLFSKSIEGLTPALEAELSQALEMLEARLHNEENGLLGALSPQGRFAFADGFDTQLRSMRLTVDKPAIHHKVGRRTRPPPPRRPVALCPRAPGRPPPLLSPAPSSLHTSQTPTLYPGAPPLLLRDHRRDHRRAGDAAADARARLHQVQGGRAHVLVPPGRRLRVGRRLRGRRRDGGGERGAHAARVRARRRAGAAPLPRLHREALGGRRPEGGGDDDGAADDRGRTPVCGAAPQRGGADLGGADRGCDRGRDGTPR